MTKQETSGMTEGMLTEQMMESMRRKAGTKMRLAGYINNEVATASAIRRFADGIGDGNPLWRDGEYAAKTRYGRIAAPPSWVWSVCAGVQMGWRGLGGFHSGTEEEFYRPVLLGDGITPEVVYLGFEGPMSSEFSERMVKDLYENRYFKQDGQLVSRLRWWVFRYERERAHRKGKYDRIELPHPWSEADLARIEQEELNEKARGLQPRYWEDTSVGDKMEPLVQGPLGLTDMIAFIASGSIPVRYQAHGVALREYRRHPAWAFRDADTHAWEPVFAAHYNRRAANFQGVPFCYDLGIQRHCWLDRFFTNWAGDEGWLKKSRAEYRSFVYLSDVLWFNGEVTKKYVDEEGEFCVDLTVNVTNQREENVMPATATVALPSKDGQVYPVVRRLRS